LHEVDVGEAALVSPVGVSKMRRVPGTDAWKWVETNLAEEPEDLEASAIDLECRRAREAIEAIA